MKITKNQLRRIIRESIESSNPAHYKLSEALLEYWEHADAQGKDEDEITAEIMTLSSVAQGRLGDMNSPGQWVDIDGEDRKPSKYW